MFYLSVSVSLLHLMRNKVHIVANFGRINDNDDDGAVSCIIYATELFTTYIIYIIYCYTNLSSTLAYPETHPRAASWYKPRRRNCWDAISTESGNPRHDHAHWSHPFAIVVPVSYGVDDLEVALQGDNHQTDLFGNHAKDLLSSKPTSVFLAIQRTIVLQNRTSLLDLWLLYKE